MEKDKERVVWRFGPSKTKEDERERECERVCARLYVRERERDECVCVCECLNEFCLFIGMEGVVGVYC